LRVLVAEDNAVNQRLVQHLLERRGHLVTMVGNGREAIEALAHQRFDLVLMDLQMPGMDGLEATRSIRAAEHGTRARVPIVALTAHAMQGDRQRCLAADMDGYVSKPIQPVELFEVIDKVIADGHDGPPMDHQPTASGADAGDIIHRDGLLDRVQHDPEMLQTCIDIFLSDFPGRLAGLEGALRAGDDGAATEAAHALKGAIAVFSSGPAYRAAAEIERLARARDLDAAARQGAILSAELDRLKHALGQMVATVGRLRASA
jgi:CheY-like chemotaxis protein